MTRSFSRDVDVNALSLRLARATSARVDLERALALAREESRDATLARDAATRARDAATEEARRERACAIDAIDALEACVVSERAWRERRRRGEGSLNARDAARRETRAELRELREAKEAKTVVN